MKNVQDIELEIKALGKELADATGTRTEVYSRIVGYYRSVRNWNKGKLAEYHLRKNYETENGFSAGTDMSDNAKRVDGKPYAESGDSAYANGGIGSWVLFAREACPNCPPVKKYLENVGIAGKVVDVDTEAGLELARKHDIMKAPTVLFFDTAMNVVCRAHSVRELEDVKKIGEIASSAGAVVRA